MAADQDGVLEDIVLVGQGLQDGILEILPILARLCDGSVCIADGDGRCRHRVDRNGAIVPIREVHASALVRKVSRTRRPEWEQDKNSSDLRLALPVGNRTLEIVRHSHSKTVRRPVPLGAVSEFGRTLDQPV
ncbi:MAG TPA: hypothetical protein VNF49_00975, partial [Candidatus Binataceae bacterium]|nr:hypothetical protein [Candidatus Binataceae bacterium]